MKRLTASATAFVLTLGMGVSADQSAGAVVRLTTADGYANLVAAVQREAYQPGRPAKGYITNLNRDVKTPDGLVISGFSIYGWHDRDQVHLVVLAAVPREGQENRYYDSLEDLDPRLRFLEIARYAMNTGEQRTVTEMRTVGLDPWTVAVNTSQPASSLIAVQQSTGRFEYLQVTPYVVHYPSGPQAVIERPAYRACVAGGAEWTCRQFEPSGSDPRGIDTALRNTLATLGNEGWELISAIDQTPDRDGGLVYLFKRQR